MSLLLRVHFLFAAALCGAGGAAEREQSGGGARGVAQRAGRVVADGGDVVRAGDGSALGVADQLLVE